MKKIYDLVIIGAGPAGAAAAYYSKKLDKENTKKVLLIDSLKGSKFDRYHHMCGEAVSKYIHNDFKDLRIEKYIKNKIEYIHEYWGDKELKSKNNGYIIDRPKLLKKLRNHFLDNNGKFLNQRVKSFTEGKNNILIKTSKEKISTEYLILATGPNHPKNNIITLKGTLNNTLLSQITLQKYPLENKTIKFYYNEKYKENYKWIFPYGKQVKIGVPFSNKDELKLYEKYNIIQKDTKQVFSGVLKNYAFGNTILIGDAAFQNNPLTKGGIRTAFHAAKIAVNSILNYENPSRYDKIWKNCKFNNKRFLPAVKILKTMKNMELEKISKLLKIYPLSYPICKIKNKKYTNLFNIFSLSNKYGW